MKLSSTIKSVRAYGINGVLIALPFLIMAIGLVFMAANVPFADDYDAIVKYINYPWPERFFHLGDFHNEHRIIVTRLVCECVFITLKHIDFRIIMWIGNIGWWFFVGVIACIFARREHLGRWGAVFATWMLVGFYDQENVFWAMTSIQNHWVIVLALASCLAFSRRTNPYWFATSLVLAVVATFTSGGGLIVFPALLLMVFCDCAFERHHALTWNRFGGLMIVITVAFITNYTFLIEFPHNTDPTLVFSTDITIRIKEAIMFFFCFFGNLLPAVVPSFIVGIVIVIWGLVICWFAPRYRGTSLAIFAFIAFCVANILAATVFRGCKAELALPGRYRLVSTALVVSLLYLTLFEIPLCDRYKKKLLVLSLIGCFFISSAYLVRGIIYNSRHKAELEAELSYLPIGGIMSATPTNETYRAYDSPMLRTAIRKGIYIPPICKQ